MMNPRLDSSGGLYAITDGPRPDLLEAVEAALRGGARLVQYRDTTDDPIRRRKEACALVELGKRHDVPVLIDHDLDLVRASGAAGVHLGAMDADPDQIRRLLGPDAIIGVSCYGNLDRARAMTAKGADYLSFGAFHASPTKPEAVQVDPDLLRQAATLGPAVVAIGGITPDNGSPLIAAGAHFLASISTLFSADDVQSTARRFSAMFPTRTQAS
jgi:thiamine-phosphate pyrophosphorylase